MTQETFKGSCLCGQVRYELTGEPERFYHCHCERCRKATGTGHASNIMVKAINFNWISGSELLHRFNVPDAERFYSLFCSHCGSGMPREVPELGFTIIPAGSLDSEPSVQPKARIFWDSRSNWSCDGRNLVSYPEYEK
jgi:hypothetical protein